MPSILKKPSSSDVNLAQRLESNAPVGGILIAQRTAELIRGRIPTVERGTIAIKGLGDAVAVYEVPVEPAAAAETPA